MVGQIRGIADGVADVRVLALILVAVEERDVELAACTVKADRAIDELEEMVKNDSANIIARLEGTVTPERVFVLGAHFDTVEGSPGADGINETLRTSFRALLF